MGKRSNFKRLAKDKYLTPLDAVVPLFPFLPPATQFVEPCAGDGRLIRHIESAGHKCVFACDVDPQDNHGMGIIKADALQISSVGANYIITNPPWTRSKDGTGPMHDMIKHFVELAETWLLFDSDWAHTLQATPFGKNCRDIVSVGRVRWIEGSKNDGKDNCAWYHFSKIPGPTLFHFRQ